MVKLSVDLLCRCTGHASKRRRDENQEQYLARITHLYCSYKQVEKIVSLIIKNHLSKHYCASMHVSSLPIGMSQSV